ncbi:MAG: hypothetical protein E6I87_08885 [Chloroflexi bacterium]|nr:MAG: hypothetical protein E6I87_08885 [Chloroflexota bacterium]
MFGARRGIAPHLAGWLWADLLLGLFVIFLAAAAAPAPEMVHAAPSTTPQRTPIPQPSGTPAPTPTPRVVDPRPIELTIPIDAQTLLSGTTDAIGREQRRIADEVDARVQARAGTRQIAVALAFASYRDPAESDRLTRLCTAALRSRAFEVAFVKSYPAAVADGGSTLTLELYLFP